MCCSCSLVCCLPLPLVSLLPAPILLLTSLHGAFLEFLHFFLAGSYPMHACNYTMHSAALLFLSCFVQQLGLYRKEFQVLKHRVNTCKLHGIFFFPEGLAQRMNCHILPDRTVLLEFCISFVFFFNYEKIRTMNFSIQKKF